eukprot:TRINITY_DN18138_c0_g1_i1.p1 TRINITY_DN18138_c0_g1~~TRINITY_DN18138_c0_g1_i1.p1  ORF type:complete len:336 (+),score=70.08 TRINITY_DN18138_c0_g1_i1:109-1116(+)
MNQEHVRRAHPITLTQYILASQQKRPEASGDLSILLHSIEIASKYVSAQVRAAGLLNLYGLQGEVNVQGEEVKKLDVIANEAFITALKRSQKVCIMASEEDAEPIIVEDHLSAKYVVAFDPLDGSSNIDANASIGTIFAIYKRLSPTSERPTVKDLLQPGTNLVAAGYTLYGSATLMVLSTGEGVNGFMLDPSCGEFVLSLSDIVMPNKGNIYSVNEGNSKFWLESTKKYVDGVKNPEKGNPYSLRYIGSMVADVHRTLVYGGVFMYPGDTRAKDGKLRLLYEANPMAFLSVKAGGGAVTGSSNILDVVPTDIHQRVPVFLGSKENVEEISKLHS